MRDFTVSFDCILDNNGEKYIESKLDPKALSIGGLAKHLSIEDLEGVVIDSDLVRKVSYNDWDKILAYTWECGAENREWAAEIRLCQLADDRFLVAFYAEEIGYDCVHVVTQDIILDYLEGNDFDDSGYEHFTADEKYMVCYALNEGDGPSGCGNIKIGKLYTRQ